MARMTQQEAAEFVTSLELEADKLPSIDVDENRFADAVDAAPEHFAAFRAWMRKVAKHREEEAAQSATAALAKTKCPLSDEQLAKVGKGSYRIAFEINGSEIKGSSRQFETGSYGYNVTGKTVVKIDGVECPVQVTGNIILIGSKREKAQAA